MPRLYSHPRGYRNKFLANYLCIGFVPGGTASFFPGDTKADKKKKAQESSPELRGLVGVFLGFSPEVRVNFRQFFPFIGFWGTQLCFDNQCWAP